MERVNINTPVKIVNDVFGTVHSIDLKPGKIFQDGTCSARDLKQINVTFDNMNVGKCLTELKDLKSQICTISCVYVDHPQNKRFRGQSTRLDD